jgi:hypothetical protein
MTRYLIFDGRHSSEFLVESDYVIETGTLLSGLKGRYWPDVRAHLESNQWTIEPVPEDPQTTRIAYGNKAYEFFWSHGTLQRITLHEGEESFDIRYSQLPDMVKRLI